MTIVKALLELLSCKSFNGHSVTHGHLEEQNESKLKKLTITNLRPGMLILHIDEGRKITYSCAGQDKTAAVGMSPLFCNEGQHDCQRGCDAVLIRELDGFECEIFYLELKSDTPSGFAGQFRSTRCFFQYVRVLLKEFWQIDMKITRERFIVFHTDTRNARPIIGKQPTRRSPASANRPEEPVRYIVRDREEVHCMKFM